jgi:hypothetical protein
MNDKVYHIYAKDRCLFHNLSEEEFKKVWKMLTTLVEVVGETRKEDLSFEELLVSKDNSINSSY